MSTECLRKILHLKNPTEHSHFKSSEKSQSKELCLAMVPKLMSQTTTHALHIYVPKNTLERFCTITSPPLDFTGYDTELQQGLFYETTFPWFIYKQGLSNVLSVMCQTRWIIYKYILCLNVTENIIYICPNKCESNAIYKMLTMYCFSLYISLYLLLSTMRGSRLSICFLSLMYAL